MTAVGTFRQSTLRPFYSIRNQEGCVMSAVAIDALVLKHQTTSAQCTVQVIVVLD